jgi:hypothetical protein
VRRFGDANDRADSETAHHVFTSPTPFTSARQGPALVAVARGVLDGAMALYLTRYLNVPPARHSRQGGPLNDLPTDVEMIHAALLDADRQQQVDLAARLVARHFALGHSPETLIATLAHAVLRKDAGREAEARQVAAWGEVDESRHILIAVAGYLAAHSPTEHAGLQKADVARRGRRPALGIAPNRDVAKGRIARIQGSSREGLEFGRNPSFHSSAK